MTVHLLKLCVGAESIDEVIDRLPATPKETGEPAVTV